MDFRPLHSWDLDYRAAIALQNELSARVVLESRLPHEVRLVAGVDVSYRRHGEIFFAAVVVLSWPDMQPVATASAVDRVSFPYIPGLLSFRELPVLLEAFRRLDVRPDLVLVDGQGIAHPRRFGLACHLGLWLDVPTIGCAKSRLVGEGEEPGIAAGAHSLLRDGDEIIGALVRTRTGVRPLYISPGHGVDMKAAVDWTLRCCRGYRLPEPTRQAHLLTNRLRLEFEKNQAIG
ncbi:MAG: deoxyribonuclease V [Geothermobacteraceae bacterium]